MYLQTQTQEHSSASAMTRKPSVRIWKKTPQPQVATLKVLGAIKMFGAKARRNSSAKNVNFLGQNSSRDFSQHFDGADADDDGMLDFDEWRTYFARSKSDEEAKTMFGTIDKQDKNHDARLSHDEVIEWIKLHPEVLGAGGHTADAKTRQNKEEEEGFADEGAEMYFKAAHNWQQLINDAIKTNAQFAVLWREYKQYCKRATLQDYLQTGDYLKALGTVWMSCTNMSCTNILRQVHQKSSQEQDENQEELAAKDESEKALHQLKSTLESYHDACWQPGHPIPVSLRLDLYRYAAFEKRIIKAREAACRERLRKLYYTTDDNNEYTLLKDTVSDQEENEIKTDERAALECMQICKEKKLAKLLILLEGLYVHLLGPSFRYRLGIQGTELDLFFWNVLQNKRDLSMEMWKRVLYPVRSAICAAYLLRKMADNEHTDPITRLKMLENANYFEDQAIVVQKAAEEDDRDLAFKSVDCELYLWRGMALMDVAVKSECHRFVETECCTQAIQYRLYGDLSPYAASETLLGRCKIFASVFSFGILPILMPNFLVWTPPPMSPVLRRRTQRRETPMGYPYQPSTNAALNEVREKLRIKNDNKKYA